MRAVFRAVCFCRRGAVAVEMALIGMAVFFMVPLIADLALLTTRMMDLSSGVRGGVQVALVRPTDIAAITTAVRQASGLPASQVNVTTQNFCRCSNTGQACGGGNNNCPNGTSPYTFMTITANHTVRSLLTYPGGQQQLTRSATLRIQ